MRHIYCENSIYSAEYRCLIPCYVLEIITYVWEEIIYFIASHGFENESFVVTEKEEASTIARILTCFENHFSVFFTFERIFNVLCSDAIKLSDLLENCRVMGFYLNFLLHDKLFIWSLLDTMAHKFIDCLSFFTNTRISIDCSKAYKLLMRQVLICLPELFTSLKLDLW